MQSLSSMIGKIIKKIKPSLIFFRWPLLSGILIGTSYIPFPPWASLFCLVPLWYFWIQNPIPRAAFWGGWWTSFTLTFIGFFWVNHTIYEFSHLPWFVSVFIFLLFCSLGNIHLALVGWIWSYTVQKSTLKSTDPEALILLPLLYFLLEYYFPMIFMWNFGYTWFYSGLPLYQVAEWVGFSGLSGWVIFSNWVLLKALLNPNKRISHISIIFISFCILNVLGFYLKESLPAPDREAKILTVQANIGNLEKQFAEKGWGFRDHILNRYFTLTREGLKKNPHIPIDFVFWPETAFPDTLTEQKINWGPPRTLTHFLQQNSLNLVTGAYSEDPTQNNKPTNSLIALTSQGKISSAPYHKTHLLAFGEYLPFGEPFPWLKDLLPMVSDFARGSGPQIITLNDLRLGAQICYEGLFPYFSTELAHKGAQILLNVTNDSWYGSYSEPLQHMYMTLGRAIETRRPLVRVTNTGFTTAITPQGEILTRSPLFQEWQNLYRIPYYHKPPTTFFQQYGIYLVPLFFWVLLILASGRIISRVRFRKH